MKISILCLLAMSSLSLAAPVHSPWPGGIAVISIDGAERPTVTLGDNPVLVLNNDDGWVAVVGIPLEQDAQSPLDIVVRRTGQDEQTLSVNLRETDYRVQRLNVDRKYVDPGQEALDRIFAERKVLDAALTNWRPGSWVGARGSAGRSASPGCRRR